MGLEGVGVELAAKAPRTLSSSLSSARRAWDAKLHAAETHRNLIFRVAPSQSPMVKIP
jgi:hypothetical protein